MSEAIATGTQKSLSARQIEIAQLLIAGYSTRAVADALSLSPRTVESHVAAIFEKLGIRSRSQLAARLAGATEVLQAGALPTAPHPLIGRTADLVAVTRLVAASALVTIVGTGGIGKTQLSIRVATEVRANYAGGAWFVELASLTSGDYIAPEIARVLAIAASGSHDDVLATLTQRLRATRALLIFDSCEHLIEPLSATIATIVRACPGLSILATSREPLGISGEFTYRLPALAPSDARRLFIERAQGVDHRIAIDEDATGAIDEICRRLDGIPLAIELAAAHANVFSPTALLQRLESRFALLAGGRRDVLPRHQSMSAVLDWSYELLDDRERRFFRRLAIFSGRFTLEAALAISGMTADTEAQLLDVLASLIGKSLVVAEPERSAIVYRLLETTRIYAGSKLDESEEKNDVARLHMRYLRDTLTAITARARIWMSQEAVTFFQREQSDLRAALARALHADVAEGAELLVATHALWSVGSLREGIALVDAYLAALEPGHAILRAKLLTWLTELHWRNGNHDRAIACGKRAVATAQESEDAATLGMALFASAGVSVVRDPHYAREALDRADALAETPEMTRYECRSLRARLTYLSDDYERAIPMYRALIDEAQRLGDEMGRAEGLRSLGLIEYKSGRYDRAVEFARDAVAIVRNVVEPWMCAIFTLTLGNCLVRTGDFDQARKSAWQALTLLAEVDPECHHIGTAIETIGCALAVEGDFARALILQGKARAIAAQPGIFRGATDSHVTERFDELVCNALTEDERSTLRARGAQLALEEVVAIAGSF